MADIIKTIGAAGSGADYATVQAWFAARTGGAGDRYIGEIITSAGGLHSGSSMTGEYSGELILRAGAGLEFDPTNPATPHAKISNAATLNWTTSSKVTLENIELQCTAASPTTALINTGTGAPNVTVRKCWLRGGRYGVICSVAGTALLVENSIIQGTTRLGVYNFVSGATIRNTVITGCNTLGGTTSSDGGVRKDVAGTVLDNVLCIGNSVVGFYGTSTTATVSYLSSSDSSASGSNALTGVATSAVTDYANNIFTAAVGGVLDNTGPSGNDRGLVLAGTPSIYITSPVAWQLIARDPVSNTGSIAITGTYTDVAPASIEARWNGGAWTTIDDTVSGGSYSGTLTGLTAGNGTLEVRVSNATSVTASVANIAIGAKFLFWGQSNTSGRATNAQPYTGTAGWYHKYTVTNAAWQQGADPFDTETANGSLYSKLASLLTAQLNCPVAFIGVGKGSTALSVWQSGQTLNTRMVTYYGAAGTDGIEAVVSWIGESDADAATAETTFKTQYNAVIDQLRTLTGKKSLLVAPSGLANADYANVRQWVSDIAATSANTYAEEVQMWPLFQGVHYVSDAETNLAATAIYDSMVSQIYTAPVINFEADLVSQSTIGASLTAGIRFKADLTSVSGVAASFTTGIRLKSNLAGQSLVSAGLTTGIRFKADLVGQSSLTASMTIASSGMRANLTGQSTVGASLTTGIRFKTNLVNQSTLAASFASNAAKFAANIISQSTIGAGLTTGIRLKANLVNQSIVSAKLTHIGQMPDINLMGVTLVRVTPKFSLVRLP